MIRITVYRNSDGYTGFRSEGHAGYAEEGYDIICAAVSALTVNAVNSIETLTADAFSLEEGDGLIVCRFPEKLSSEGTLLMDSLVLGLKEIRNAYGKHYIQISYKEV